MISASRLAFATVSAAADNKTYDGSTTTTVHLSISGVASGDDVQTNVGSANFSDKNVGTGKSVSLTGLTLSGADAGNYVLNDQSGTNASIIPLSIDVTVSAGDKVYDGTTTAMATVTPIGTLGNDDVQGVYGVAEFSDKNVGGGKAVSVGGVYLTGADADNYTFTNTSVTATAAITRALLTASASASSKTYDGTTGTSATVSLGGVVGSDDVSASGTGNFDDPNVGRIKNVTVAVSLSGADAANYTVASTTTTTTDIYRREISVSVWAQDKTYDSTTTTAQVVFTVTGVLNFESVGVSYTSANFDSADAGTGRVVTVSGVALTGTDASNYSAGSSTSCTAGVNALQVTVSAVGQNKVYDGSTAGTVTLTVSGVLPGDSVNASCFDAQFSDPNIGSGKTIYVTGITLDNSNYYVASSCTTATADITDEGG